jgi:hypothetical protein
MLPEQRIENGFKELTLTGAKIDTFQVQAAGMLVDETTKTKEQRGISSAEFNI